VTSGGEVEDDDDGDQMGLVQFVAVEMEKRSFLLGGKFFVSSRRSSGRRSSPARLAGDVSPSPSTSTSSGLREVNKSPPIRAALGSRE